MTLAGGYRVWILGYIDEVLAILSGGLGYPDGVNAVRITAERCRKRYGIGHDVCKSFGEIPWK
jgi:hypothetical protein